MTDKQSEPMPASGEIPQRTPYQERVPEALFPLFSWGQPHDEETDEMFDYAAVASDFRDHVEPLIELLIDEARWIKEHGEQEQIDEDDEDAINAVWAPYHAVLLLRELAPPEAAAPLLEVLDSGDDLLIEGLPDLYAAIGAPSLPVLKGYVTDQDKKLDSRAYVLRIIGAVGESNDDLADEVTAYLIDTLQREDHDSSRDDEFLNGSIVSALCDLHAEAVKESDESADDNAVFQAVMAAFDEQCVDPSIVGRDDVRIEFGARGPWTEEEKMRNLHTPRFSLTCLSCGRDRPHEVTRVFYDIERDSGEGVFSGEGHEDDPYGPLYIPDTITCPKCGAVDQYKPSARSLQAIGIQAMMLSMNLKDEATEGSPIRFVSFDSLGFGGHPREAEANFRRQLADQPTDPEFFITYGKLLLFMNRADLAAHQFARAVQLDPDHAEGYYYLAFLAEQDDDVEQALYFWEKVRVSATLTKGLSRKRKREMISAANKRLSLVNDGGGQGSEAKVKPNAPCPCGSGKKYKKCCMR